MQRRRSMPHTFEENIAAEKSRAMDSIPPPADAQEYLESLMRAGQDAMKQFVDALGSAAGVRTEESLSSGRPLFPDRRPSARTSQAGMALAMFHQTSLGGAHADVALAKGDKRFKDASWREQPYYDLSQADLFAGLKAIARVRGQGAGG